MSQIPFRASRATLASFAAMGVLWGAYFGMAPATKAMLGIDDGHWALLFLCSSSGALVAMRAAPALGAALGRATLPAGMAAMAAIFALVAHVDWLPLFAACVALMGMTTGSLDVLMNARVSAIEAERDAHLMSLHHAVFSFAYAGSAAITGLARAAGHGPVAVLSTAAALALLLALIALERRPAVASEPAAGGGGRRALGPVPLIGGGVILIGFLAENATEAWSAIHVERTLHAAAGFGSYGPALLGLTMGLGRMSAQLLARRLAEVTLLRLASLTAAAGALIAAAAPVAAVADLGFAVLGLGVSVIAPVAFALVGRLTRPGLRAQAIARAATLGYLGFFIGPSILGAVAEGFGLRAAFATVALILLLALPLLPPLARRAAPA